MTVIHERDVYSRDAACALRQAFYIVALPKHF